MIELHACAHTFVSADGQAIIKGASYQLTAKTDHLAIGISPFIRYGMI